MTQFTCVITGICVVTGNECLIPWQHPHQPWNNKHINFEFNILTTYCFYSPILPTCIYNEDCCTGKGGSIKTTFVLSEVAPHHRTQNKTNTRCCIEVSHHQGALWLWHQVRQQSSADGQRVLEEPCNRKRCTLTAWLIVTVPMCTYISILCNVRWTWLKCNMCKFVLHNLQSLVTIILQWIRCLQFKPKILCLGIFTHYELFWYNFLHIFGKSVFTIHIFPSIPTILFPLTTF